jgi:glycosyltransferase involved in cell wall biosynthesis
LFTGTLTPKKGILSLISAWSIVKEKNSLAVLDVYGKDEPLKNGASSMQAHLLDQIPPEFRHSVRFHGHVDRKTLLSALQSARVAVFPSYTETFGLCAAEAMACGCPTIYTKLSCGPEVVRDRVDGLLVDPDRPSEIAETILTLLSSEEMAGRLSEAGRARVLELYSLEKLLPANREFLNEAIRSFSKRSNPKTWTSKWSNKVAL